MIKKVICNMKRKHKMNIGLAFLVVALMVSSATAISQTQASKAKDILESKSCGDTDAGYKQALALHRVSVKTRGTCSGAFDCGILGTIRSARFKPVFVVAAVVMFNDGPGKYGWTLEIDGKPAPREGRLYGFIGRTCHYFDSQLNPQFEVVSGTAFMVDI